MLVSKKDLKTIENLKQLFVVYLTTMKYGKLFVAIQLQENIQ